MEKVILITGREGCYSYTDTDGGLDFTKPEFMKKQQAIKAAIKEFGKKIKFAGEGMTLVECRKYKVHYAGESYVWSRN
jgi:hypothetical protein